MDTHRFAACLLFVGMTISVFSFGQTATSSAAPTLTLDDAVTIAIHENRQLKISGLDVARARESVAAARTNFFPQLNSYVLSGIPLERLSFTIPAGTLGVYPSTGPIPGKTSTISTPERFSSFIYASAGQPLTQLYKVNLAVREAGLGLDLTKESLRAQHQETVRQVKEAYHQLAETQSEISSAEAGVKYLEELSQLMDRNLKQQTVLLSDSLIVKAKLKQQRYQLLTLQDAFDLQKESFNRLLGRDVRTAFTVEPQPAPDALELDLEAARKRALEQRAEIREARLQSEVAEMEVRREKAEYIPDLSLQVTYLSFQNINFLPENFASLGFAFSWQPFDWGYKKHKTGELKAVAQQKGLTEQDAEQLILVDVDQKYRKLNEARMLLEANGDARTAEQQKLQEMTRGFDQKTILLSGLLEQQATVSQAEAKYQEALANFWTARADFERALGDD